MKDHLSTDFLKVEDFKNIKSKKYLELPDFDKIFNFSKILFLTEIGKIIIKNF